MPRHDRASPGGLAGNVPREAEKDGLRSCSGLVSRSLVESACPWTGCDLIRLSTEMMQPDELDERPVVLPLLGTFHAHERCRSAQPFGKRPPNLLEPPSEEVVDHVLQFPYDFAKHGL